MTKRVKHFYNKTSLAAKIRFSYVIMLIPLLILFFVMMFNVFRINNQYDSMIHSLSVASEFSLDFKKDFDYETYLLIIGNKTADESELDSILEHAESVVDGLDDVTTSTEGAKYLESTQKYLTNLKNYRDKIIANLDEGNKYEENMEIWENDVQIVTALISDTVNEYVHSELKELQIARQGFQRVYTRMTTAMVIAIVIILILITFLSFYIPQSITRPITELRQLTDKVAGGDLSVRASSDGGVDIRALGESLNKMIQEISDLLEQVKSEQIRLRKAEIRLLQAQINPHFLYNTLDAIVWLAESGEQKMVVNMVGSLSEFFRTSLNDGKDIITIREELQHVRSYLEIQRVRYQDIMEFSIDIPSDIYEYLIPKITLQPLVENALYHGIKNKRGLGKITITGEKSGDDVVFVIEDNGKGMTEERLREVRDGLRNKSHIENDIYGIYNVNERIQLNMGDEYGLSVESEYEVGTKVTITLPCESNLIP